MHTVILWVFSMATLYMFLSMNEKTLLRNFFSNCFELSLAWHFASLSLEHCNILNIEQVVKRHV